MVTRHGRLGWALDDAKGPENANLPPTRLEEIHRAFAAVGIPIGSAVSAVEYAILELRLRREDRRRHRRGCVADEYEETYEEIEAAEAAVG